ncbi:MAG: hypothetical protein P1V51_13430 [Deltaproteobacteria bacterium]|nr:hypothetical protein [Deltaproteobacteria bacterium]
MRAALGLSLLAAALLVAGPALARKPRGKAKVVRTPLARACEDVKLVEHGLDLLAAPLATEGTRPRALPARNYSELAFVADEWLALREVGAPSEIMVINVDGGEPLPLSPPGLFCGGLERTGFEDGVRFHCRKQDADPEQRRFFVARPPEWKAVPDDGLDWSYTLRERDAAQLGGLGHASHDVFRMASGHRVGVPRRGFGVSTLPHPFLAWKPGSPRLLAPPADLEAQHYPAAFREAPRVAASLKGGGSGAGAALLVLDLEKGQTLCASRPQGQPITAYLGASRDRALFLRGQLPIWRPLEVHLADLSTGTDHHLGSVPVNTNALIRALPDDRFLLILLPEDPPRTFRAHFLLVDGRSLEVKKLSEPVGDILHNLYGVEVSPGGGWLRFNDGRSHPWILPIPRRPSVPAP